MKAQTYGTEDYVDWICVGNHGNGYAQDREKLGSLASAVLRGKLMNVLFVPN